MINIKERVEDCLRKVLKEQGVLSDNVSSETLLIRENGIDSLGIVSLILEIEEEFEIDLDLYLPEIRKCNTLGELEKIVESVITYE